MDNEDFLTHIIEAIDSINSFVQDISYEHFREQDIISSAVVRKLEIIGEAIKNIDQDLKDKYDNIEWRKASGMRNFLIHEYFRVNYKAVWNTIHQDLPAFKEQIQSVLKDITMSQAT